MQNNDINFSEAIRDMIRHQLESITGANATNLLKVDPKTKKNKIKGVYQELMILKAKIESIIEVETRTGLLDRWTLLENRYLALCEAFIQIGNLRSLREVFDPSKEQMQAIQGNERASDLMNSLRGVYNDLNKLIEAYNDYYRDHIIGRFDDIKCEMCIDEANATYVGLLDGEWVEYRREADDTITFIAQIYDYNRTQSYKEDAKQRFGEEIDSSTAEDAELVENRMDEVERDMIEKMGDLKTFPHDGKHLRKKDGSTGILKSAKVDSSNGGAAKYDSTDPIEVRKLEHYARTYGWVTAGNENIHKFPFVVGADRGEETQCVRIDGDHGHPIVEDDSTINTAFLSYLKKDWEHQDTQKSEERQEEFKRYMKRIGYGGLFFKWKNFTWDSAIDVNGESFIVGSASGEGLNCLIDSIRIALGLNTSAERIAEIRQALIDAGLAQANQFLYNDQRVLEEILVALNQDPNDVNIFFTQGNLMDNWTYNFGGGTTIYIHNANNVHFSPMSKNDA
ncbi:hypothetical protein [Aureispira sp. CCB-QB1]|uniref:hypothetical protein n=1 Tax=Aureispira sp. CCB-QB1 TaxID=1313421 RepID=UPI0006980B5C|nr:hypothetical protein [Aureispira sp. CCB-QB1]